jgi:hypothetical protein
MKVSGQHCAPAALLPRERAPGNHWIGWIGGWVGPRVGLDAVVKIKIRGLYSDYILEKGIYNIFGKSLNLTENFCTPLVANKKLHVICKAL